MDELVNRRGRMRQQRRKGTNKKHVLRNFTGLHPVFLPVAAQAPERPRSDLPAGSVTRVRQSPCVALLSTGSLMHIPSDARPSHVLLGSVEGEKQAPNQKPAGMCDVNL